MLDIQSSPTEGVHITEDHSIKTRDERRKQFRNKLVERQQGKGVRLKDFLLKLRDEYRSRDREARLRRLMDIDLMLRYYNGDQYGSHNTQGVWEPMTIPDGDYAYTIPVINGHVDEAVSQILKTNIEYDIAANSKTDPTAQLLANMCQEIAAEERARLWKSEKSEKRQREILNMVLAGESQRRIYWAPDPDSPRMVTRMEYASEQVELAGGRECQACHSEVAQDAPACECGATHIINKPGGVATRNVPQEVEKPLCENQLHIPHPMAIQRSLSAMEIKHSTFIIERDFLDKRVAEWTYQTILNTADSQLSPEMRMRSDLERATIQTDAIVGSSHALSWFNELSQSVEREHIFADVADYGHFFCDVEETLPDGSKIDAQTFLADKYPEGVYFLCIGNDVLVIMPINKNRQWSEVIYGMRPGAAGGAGLKILVVLQDIVNDTFNLDYAILNTHGRPLTAVSRRHVPALPEAGQVLYVDKVPEQGMDSIIKQWPGQGANGMVGATSEYIQRAMQFIGGTQIIGQYGAADMQAAQHTATGVNAAVEQAASRMVAPIGMIIAADIEMTFQCLENIKEYSETEQIKELEKRFGTDVVAEFKKCNFRKSLTITVAGNTDMPRSLTLNSANMLAFAQAAAQLKDMENGAEILSLLGDVLGIPFTVGTGRSDRREAEYRLNKLTSIEEFLKSKNPNFDVDAERASGMMIEKLVEFCGHVLVEDESQLAEGLPFVNPFLHDHAAFMDVYKDWLFGEKAKSASEAMKISVIELWNQHLKASMIKEEKLALMKQQLEAILNPQPPQPSPEEIAAAQGQQSDAATQQELLKRAADEESANQAHDQQMEGRLADHLSSQEAANQDLERQKELAAHNAQLEIDKAHAMPPPATGNTEARA